MATKMMVFFTLAAGIVLLSAGEHAAAVSGQERLLLDLTPGEHMRTVSAMPVPVARGSFTGAVEEDKAYIVGRPLFKVPPSSPCRAKAMRC